MADRNGLSWISSEGVRRAKSALAVALSFAVLLGGLGFLSWKGYSFYMDWRQREDYIGTGDEPIEIYIPADVASVGRIADILTAKEVIKDPEVFEDEYEQLPDDQVIWPGTYNLKTHLPAKTALDMLLDREHYRVTKRLTIREGLRLDQIKEQLVTDLGVTMEQVDAALATIAADPAGNQLSSWVSDPTNPEGYFFPDTYTAEPYDPLSAFQQMAGQFTTVATELNLEAGAANLSATLGTPITAQQIVVVASIIEAEVNQAQYRPQVARAIYNRLLQSMPLQVESAFRYGRLMVDGVPYDDDVTRESQLNPDLPYNYYIHPGLPAAPINNPGRDALSAAMNPVEGDWLFWVTVNLHSGETKFTASEEEFYEFVAELDQWCADNGQPTGCS